MEIVVIAVGILLLVIWAVLARRRPAPAPRRDHERTAGRAAAEAEMEDHDIDDMLDAINERRARRGARTTGDELADEAMRAKWDQDADDETR